MTDESVPEPTTAARKTSAPGSAPDPGPGVDPDATTVASPYGEPGPPLEHTPFYVGLLGGLGFAVAYWLATRFLEIGSVLILVVVAMFLAAGLNPIVEYFMSRGLKRPWALLVVIAGVLVMLSLF